MRVRVLPPLRLRAAMPSIILGGLCLYFAFYLVFGPNGLFALNRVTDVYQEKKLAYAELRSQREKLESSVKLMRPTSLDPDMAEEQARRTLGYMRADEIVIDLP